MFRHMNISKCWHQANSRGGRGAIVLSLPVMMIGACFTALSAKEYAFENTECEAAPENLYARLEKSTDWFQKVYKPPPGGNSHAEALRRARDLQEYFDLLVAAGVHVPRLRYIGLEKDSIVARSELVKPVQTNDEKVDNAFYQIANATGDRKLQDDITLLALAEVIKVMQTTMKSSKRPIGYDISPLNFMYGSTVNDTVEKMYCVDIFPPRLGFDSNGRLPIEKCLVNYPEEDFHDGDRLKRLQSAYYEPTGMIRQFLPWFIGARQSKTKAGVDTAIQESQELIDKVIKSLKDHHCAEEIVVDVSNYVKSKQFAKDLSYRLPRCREIWRESMPGSTLVVAASGEGSRAKEALGMNKLAYSIDGTPLVGQVVDAFCEDAKIDHVVFVVNSQDEGLVDAIDNYAHSRKLEYSMVLSKSGKGVGYAFYLGMQAAPKGPVLLTVGDTVPYNARGLFQTDKPVKVGVVRRESDQQHGKLGKDRTSSKDSQDQSLSLVGFYHLNSIARSKATAIFEEAMVEVEKGKSDPSVVNAKGEYRFSWLLQALNAEGISQGNGDVGSIAEMNYGKNEADITTLLRCRREVPFKI